MDREQRDHRDHENFNNIESERKSSMNFLGMSRHHTDHTIDSEVEVNNRNSIPTR